MFVFLNIKESLSFFFILLSIVMFFFCLYLYFNNKKLKQRISKLEIETKEILERKIIKENPNDLVSIQSISAESNEKKSVFYHPKPKNSKSFSQNNNYHMKASSSQSRNNTVIQKSKSENNNQYQSSSAIQNNYPYQKNIRKQNNNLTYSITNSEKDTTKILEKQNFNVNDFIQQREKVVPKIKEKQQTNDYLKEISNQIADELTPKTIELTEYEKSQEEHAIISYQELLALKDKFESQYETDEDISFIEDLKQFRDKLN